MADMEHLQMTAAARAAIDHANALGLTITSAYRTPEHNAAVGGVKGSDHVKGLAIDVAGDWNKMDEYAHWARSTHDYRIVLWQQAGHYDHVHVSWYAPKNGSWSEPTDGVVKKGDKGGIVGVIQDLIGAAQDNLFGPNTEKAVKKFQKDHGLTDDGIVGNKTWDKLTHGYGRFFYQ